MKRLIIKPEIIDSMDTIGKRLGKCILDKGERKREKVSENEEN